MFVHGAHIARARRALISQLKKADALSDASALPLEASSSLERTELKRMIKREVIREGSRGGYWLDEERYANWKRQNLLFAVGVVLVVGGIVACVAVYENSHERRGGPPAAPADSAASVDSTRTPR